MCAESLLPDDLLATFRERAARYDAENAFFHEDLVDLRERGYLRLLVPEEFGGLGAGLIEASRAQRRLAQAAPATALGINMHHVVVGAALTLYWRGDHRLDWVFEDVMAGEIFAFGISEAGNDSVLFDAAAIATPTLEGGYAVTGTKIFTSLSPVWTRLLVHAGAGEQLVFGFLERSDGGVTVADDWDTLGMRASQSCTTQLDGAVIRPEHVAALTPIGPNPEPLVWGIFGAFELLLASVYLGVGQRAVGLAVEVASRRRSRAKGIAYARDPDIRWQLATAAIGLDGALLQAEKIAGDVDALARGAAPDHGTAWFLYFSNVKGRATESAKDAVELALRTSGGAQYFRGSELERLYRDVLAGLYHPSDNESLHSAYAKALLGPLED